MKKVILILFVYSLVAWISQANADIPVTGRVNQVSNGLTNVWKTTIYPTANNLLTMHRHDYDRVIVALSDGVLKVTNNKGKVHYLKLKKDNAYFLTRDPLDELHQDENVSNYPIRVMVIEFKDAR